MDDESSFRQTTAGFFGDHGYDVAAVDTVAEGESCLRTARPDAVILDRQVRDGTALDLLPRLREIDPEVPVVVLTDQAAVQVGMQAVTAGASQLLVKPIELPALHVVIDRLVDYSRRRRREAAARRRGDDAGIDPFTGTSAAIRQLAAAARTAADRDRPVLLVGETGTGKGMVARWLHANGPRATEPFVAVDCVGRGAELAGELFGQAGASSGDGTRGLFELAHRGTLFLGELGDLDPLVQEKLLGVLDAGRLRRAGDTQDIAVDVRLVSATHVDLAAAGDRVRDDLVRRASEVVLRVPPLRDRIEDVRPVAEALLAAIGRECVRPDLALAPDAVATLERYHWPGNLRELHSVLERAAVLSPAPTITSADLRLGPAATLLPADASLTLAEVERRHIELVLSAVGGHVPRAAIRLGMPRSTLYQRLKVLGITRSQPARP